MSVVVQTLLGDALAEIGVLRAGDAMNADDGDLALRVANRYFDALNAEGRGLYGTTIPSAFPLTANHQPHTIGVAANAPDLTVSVGRPSEITLANIVLA